MWRLRQFDNFSPKYNNKHVTQHEQKRIYFLFYRFMSSVRLHTSPSIMVVFFFFIVSTRVVFITYLDASGKYDAVTFSRHLFQLWAFLHCYIENVMGKGNLCRTLVILRVLYIFSLCECIRAIHSKQNDMYTHSMQWFMMRDCSIHDIALIWMYVREKCKRSDFFG